VESKHGCSLWPRSGEERAACGHPTRTQLYLPHAEGEDQGRYKCSVCGVSPTVHMLTKVAPKLVPKLVPKGVPLPVPPPGTGGGAMASFLAYPPFPPRSQPTFCAVAGDAAEGEHWPRVSTVGESMLRRDQAIQWLRGQACQCECTVVGGGESMNVVTRVFPVGLSHVRGLCGPLGKRLDVTLHTDKSTGGSNSLIIHGTAAEAGGDGESKPPGFTVIARMKLERANYQSGRIPSTLGPAVMDSDGRYTSSKNGRAVPCAPAESNGGQRCAALQEACTLMLADLTTTLELQGVPGWPEIYGLGCCEYRLNATHSAPLVVDARQPLQAAAIWEVKYRRPNKKKKEAAALAAAQEAPTSPASYDEMLNTRVPGYAQYAGQGNAMSTCLEATPPLSLEQCALRAALLSAELLRGLTEERMISLNEHVLVPSRRRLQQMRRRVEEVLLTQESGNDVLGLSLSEPVDVPEESTEEASTPVSTSGRRLAPDRRPSPTGTTPSTGTTPPVRRTQAALLRGLGHASGQFAFVRATGQVAVADTDHLGWSLSQTPSLRKPTSYLSETKDFVQCYSNSVLKPLLLLDEKGEGGVPRPHNLKFVKLLVDEIEARHQLLKADAATLNGTERGVVQMSFSCIHAWLRAAGAEILPAEAMARAAPFNRLQGGWGAGEATITPGAAAMARHGHQGHQHSWGGTTVAAAGVCSTGGRVGYCDATNDGPSDCSTDHKGTWPLHKKNGSDFTEQCQARCRRCANCRYVSILQAKHGGTSACDWFSNCTSGPLQTAFDGMSYTTYAVRN